MKGLSISQKTKVIKLFLIGQTYDYINKICSAVGCSWLPSNSVLLGVLFCSNGICSLAYDTYQGYANSSCSQCPLTISIYWHNIL